MMMMRFKGSVGLVTGASQGLGSHIAKSFAEEGAIVGLLYRSSDDKASQVLEEIRSMGGKGVKIKTDVRNFKEVNQSVQAFFKEYGKIDFLINNAAILEDEPFALMSPEKWATVIDTNLTGAFNCSRAVIRPMLSKRKGAIINISSVAGTSASPGQVNYSASKGGLIAMSRSMAAELATYGIRVNTLVPGLVKEGMMHKLDRRIVESYRERIPVARFANAREISSVVTFLASEDASYIIGQAIVVDGGLTL
jgi:3-oxoacyl-[acyl-carrier protein] reductase